MDTVYRVRDATTWHEVDDEIVALDTVESVYYSIAGFGALLWPSLVVGASKRSLVGQVTTAFPDVPKAQASSDVAEFVASCLGNRLIEESDQ